MEKNQVLTVTIEDITSEGDGLGKVDGFPLFIKDAVPGDIVECSIMKLKKNYGYARLQKILQPSEKRIELRCAKARACGGCQLQQMNYQAQLDFKTNKVRQNLKRIGGLEEVDVLPCIGMEEPWRYRNKAQVPFGKDKNGRITAGFFAGRTHDIIPMEDCVLTPECVTDVLETVRAYMEEFRIAPYDEASHSGLVRHVLVRKGFTTGEIMVCLIINGKTLPHAEELLTRLQNIDFTTREERLVTLTVNINTKPGNTILGHETHTLYGPGYIEDYIGDVRFRISPNSFYQVNPVQTRVLYGKALEFAGLTGNETVWDLYCGIGTISLFLAQQAKYVYGVEIVPQAIIDAKENAALNGFENTEFYTGSAEEVLPEWYSTHQDQKIDVICVDPPRKGLDTVCIDTILKIAPEKLVYVSCDSATLSRDLKLLTEGGYQIEKVQPVDMFPQTVHVETVCLLSKLREAKHHVSVKLDMDEMDITSAESKATYEEIKKYVAEHNDGMKVSSLNIAQVKAKYGIIERENFNKPKSEEAKQPQCSKEKEDAIVEAVKAFQMI